MFGIQFYWKKSLKTPKYCQKIDKNGLENFEKETCENLHGIIVKQYTIL